VNRVRCGALACSISALFGPLLFPLATGRVFTRDDFAALHLPFRYLYQQALRSGGSWLWTSAYHSGFYLHGEGEAGMTHPLHLLLYRLLPLGVAFNLEIATTYVAMLLGTVLLARRLGLTTAAAWFGAMTFTFSGFNLFNVMHVNHIAAVAHLPWLLLAAHVQLTSDDRRSRALAFAAAAVVVGSQLLVGNPQYLWLTGVALAFEVVCLVWRGTSARRLALLGTAYLVGLLIGAIQLLPTIDFAFESTRRGWTAADALSFSLSPLNLVQLWSPFAFRFRIHAPETEAFIVHEFIVYNGAFCTIALAWIAMRWRVLARRGLATALLILAALSLVLAFGRYGVVYGWLAHLPGLRTLRAPSRHVLLFQLALSGLATIAFEDLVALRQSGERLQWRRLWPIVVQAVLGVATSLAAGLLAHTAWAAARGLMLSTVLRAAPATAIVVAMSALVIAATRGRELALAAIVAFTAVDLGVWGYAYLYRWGPIQRIENIAVDVPGAARAGDLIAPSIVGGINNVAVMRGFRIMPGYTGLVASSVLDASNPTAQRLAGVIWRETGYDWAPLSDTMPRARLLANARPVADIPAALAQVDIGTTALVDHSLESFTASATGDSSRGAAAVVEDRPGSIVVDTDAPSRRVLVLTERFHSGWRVSEDGRPQASLRVYGDFLGCIVDGGRHRVSMTFAPASFALGGRLTLVGLVATAIATGFLWPTTGSAAHERVRPVRT